MHTIPNNIRTTTMTATKPVLITELHDVLAVKNAHERDQNIVFQEKGHVYTILNDRNSKYTSVTTWNKQHFREFDADKIIHKMMNGKKWQPGHKYWGMTAQQIKDQWARNSSSVSSAGTDMHFNIECFMNNPSVPYPYTQSDLLANYETCVGEPPNFEPATEWTYFLEFAKAHGDKRPYRTEWLIYDDDLKLSGSIDMVYENEDGTLSIYDWKRSKEITKINRYDDTAITECINYLPDTNFWHYSLQLNTYKRILERKYGKTVKDLYLVRLHPDCERQTYELLKVPNLEREIDALFAEMAPETCAESTDVI